MQFITLNEVLWLALIVGIILNWAIDAWHWNIKEVIANVMFVGLIWVVTEYLITITPASTWGQSIYVVVACVIAFSPIEIFKAIKSGGKDSVIKWFNQKRETITQKDGTTVQSTETTTKTEEPKP